MSGITKTTGEAIQNILQNVITTTENIGELVNQTTNDMAKNVGFSAKMPGTA